MSSASSLRCEYLYTCVVTIKIDGKCFYIGLKMLKYVILYQSRTSRAHRESRHSSMLHNLNSVNIVLSYLLGG